MPKTNQTSKKPTHHRRRINALQETVERLESENARLRGQRARHQDQFHAGRPQRMVPPARVPQERSVQQSSSSSSSSRTPMSVVPASSGAPGVSMDITLRDQPRDAEDADAKDYRTLMDQLPDNLSEQPTQFHINLVFYADEPQQQNPGHMTVDIDISHAMRDAGGQLPIYDLRLSQVADNVTPEWYANAIVGIAYDWVLSKTNLQRNEEMDRGRVILESSDLQQRKISTPTVEIQRLPDAILATIIGVMQSSEAFDVNNKVQANVQILVAPRGGAGTRQIKLDVESFFLRQTVLDPDWVQPPGAGLCMILAVLMSRARCSNRATGEIMRGEGHDHLPTEVVAFGNDVCGDEIARHGYDCGTTLENAKFAYQMKWDSYQTIIRELQRMLMQLNPNHRPPHEWVESDLENIATFLRVTIHVLAFDCGCGEVVRYGKQYIWRHVYILRNKSHYFAVYRPQNLIRNNTKSGRTQNRSGEQLLCDGCLKPTVGNGPKHRLKCLPKPREQLGVDTLYQQKWAAQYTNPFQDPMTGSWENNSRLGWCNTCNRKVGVIKPPTKRQFEELDPGMDLYDDYVWNMKTEEGSRRQEECRARGHELKAMYYKLCSNCKEELPQLSHYTSRFKYMNNHVCYCRKPDLKIGQESSYWVWGSETLQKRVPGTSDTSPITELPPYLICACNMSNPEDKLEFEGDDCVDRFMRTLLNDPKFQKTTWVAHNGASFDVQFLCRWMHSHGIDYEHTQSPGSMHSYQEVLVYDLRFIDSVKFIPLPLSQFGKTFGLSQHKGDFPVKFALREHLDYEGALPPVGTDEDWYNLKQRGRSASPADAQKAVREFIAWHDEEKRKWYSTNFPNKPKWKFMEQYKSYCWQDVEVLRQGCIMYRNEFLNDTDEIDGWRALPVDPFQYMTVPQCLQAWFLAGLPEDEEIAAVPRIPNLKYMQSKIALQWLLKCEHENRIKFNDPNLRIRHLYNSPQNREYYIGLMDGGFAAVDGYTKIGDKEYFYQFHGCYWHGCPYCNPTESKNLHPHRGIPFEDVYKQTQLLSDRIRQSYPDAVLIECWEHDFDLELLTADNLDEFDARYPYTHIDTDVMSDRDVFFGGRVEVFQNMSIANLELGEEIRYIDVVSHYPNVCAFKRLCTGHPQRLLGRQIDATRLNPEHPDRYFGFFRGFINPAANDKYGGLPKKDEKGGQLIFSNRPDVYCGFLEELYERLEHGAEIEQMYEVLHFDEHQSRVGPFKGYMAHGFRNKMEASGWGDLLRDTPFEGQNVEDSQVRDALSEHLHQVNKELCRLRSDNVEKNKGKRFIAKLRINSLWGKFVQKDSYTEKLRIRRPEEYFDLMSNMRVDKESIQFNYVTDGLYESTYKWTETFVQRGAKINPFLGASVTGWARTLLHQKIREVDAVYCDTDSVIYRHLPDQPPISELGAGIGQWQNEFDTIKGKEFYALGPKCYCIVFNKPDENGAMYKIKAKGITMHATNHAALTPMDFRKTLMWHFDYNKPWDRPEVAPKMRLQHFHIGKDVYNRTKQEDGNVPMIAVHTQKDLSCTFNKRQPVRFYGNEFFTTDDLAEAYKYFNKLITIPFGFEEATMEYMSKQAYPRYYEALAKMEALMLFHPDNY